MENEHELTIFYELDQHRVHAKRQVRKPRKKGVQIEHAPTRCWKLEQQKMMTNPKT